MSAEQVGSTFVGHLAPQFTAQFLEESGWELLWASAAPLSESASDCSAQGREFC